MTLTPGTCELSVMLSVVTTCMPAFTCMSYMEFLKAVFLVGIVQIDQTEKNGGQICINRACKLQGRNFFSRVGGGNTLSPPPQISLAKLQAPFNNTTYKILYHTWCFVMGGESRELSGAGALQEVELEASIFF